MFAHSRAREVGAERGRRRCGRFSFCEWWRRSYGVNVDDRLIAPDGEGRDNQCLRTSRAREWSRARPAPLRPIFVLRMVAAQLRGQRRRPPDRTGW